MSLLSRLLSHGSSVTIPHNSSITVLQSRLFSHGSSVTVLQLRPLSYGSSIAVLLSRLSNRGSPAAALQLRLSPTKMSVDSAIVGLV